MKRFDYNLQFIRQFSSILLTIIHGMQGGLRSNRQSYISMHSGLRSNKQSYVSIHRWEPSLGLSEYQKYFIEILKIFFLVFI